jgi:hypothetical protein
MTMVGSLGAVRRRPGITLTEILIAIMIMGVGMVAVATLFPIGLLRLRDAARYSRSAYLIESSASDLESRGLLNKESFVFADFLNYLVNANNPPFWYPSPLNPNGSGRYDPFTHDSAFYGDDPYDPNNPGVASTNLGLPVAYDPLWRYQTGIYLDPLNLTMPEARFGSANIGGINNGIGYIRADPFDGGPPSANGLQRLTNFNRPAIMPAALQVPTIFVSPEDVVWQQPTDLNYIVAGTAALPAPLPVGAPSPVIPDLNTAPLYPNQQVTDWHYSWMFTGQQTAAPFNFGTTPTSNSSLGVTFDGNLVVFENRPFGISQVPGPLGTTIYQIDGETVVEAIWGYGANVAIPQGYGAGYAGGADRTVLLRWPATMNDPVVRVGDWIADVTYERAAALVATRFLGFNGGPGTGGLPNPVHNLEWDDLPAQRCFWYQVQRVVPPINDPNVANSRSMVVYVNTSLQARTVLAGGQPVFLNAALICPYVVNVIPQTITVR